MMSNVTRTMRFVCANMRLDASVLDYIMHNVCTQAYHNHANLVRTHHLDPRLVVHDTRGTCSRREYTRRDHTCDHLCMYSRDRNRRT